MAAAAETNTTPKNLITTTMQNTSDTTTSATTTTASPSTASTITNTTTTTTTTIILEQKKKEAGENEDVHSNHCYFGQYYLDAVLLAKYIDHPLGPGEGGGCPQSFEEKLETLGKHHFPLFYAHCTTSIVSQQQQLHEMTPEERLQLKLRLLDELRTKVDKTRKEIHGPKRIIITVVVVAKLGPVENKTTVELPSDPEDCRARLLTMAERAFDRISELADDIQKLCKKSEKGAATDNHNRGGGSGDGILAIVQQQHDTDRKIIQMNEDIAQLHKDIAVYRSAMGTMWRLVLNKQQLVAYNEEIFTAMPSAVADHPHNDDSSNNNDGGDEEEEEGSAKRRRRWSDGDGVE